jgi:hypothetical protein
LTFFVLPIVQRDGFPIFNSTLRYRSWLRDRNLRFSQADLPASVGHDCGVESRYRAPSVTKIPEVLFGILWAGEYNFLGVSTLAGIAETMIRVLTNPGFRYAVGLVVGRGH